MAASATPPSADVPCVAVATSGGRDSTALLHATARAAQALGLHVLALHVHHGLLPEADAWVEHLERQCADWARQGLPVALRWCRLEGCPGRGESVEAWARRERYAALSRMAREGGAALVLLAHHRRDQAETFLLQALRGGGAAGLASMPRQAVRDGLSWARPWLEQPSEAIDAYVQAHRLTHIQDPSNEDHGYARNRLRHRVMPALTAAFPQAEQALGAATRQAQQARECLQALAEIDLRAVAEGHELRLPALAVLPQARQANLLRHWLLQHCGRGPGETLLQRLLSELYVSDAPACWPAGEQVLHRYRGRLRCEPAGKGVTAMAVHEEQMIFIDGPGRQRLDAWGGWLEVRSVEEGGVAPARLRACIARARSGGEQFQLKPGGVPRSLKKQYQTLGVPAWHRGGPLLWLDESLLFVPGLGVDARLWAAPGEPQLGLEWVPDAAG
ncbi:tRNA lysidine(34) synthetase TilS [Azohydromonas australica]|uniref:tRNA lysidine(34) synthetase TilS n=1 Tax=Azohydromonas australica TaxID=364039 RepID=UPI000428ECFB|nr:tRNA lysidine(34) synthetase TilS [Azohydromonas australica]